MTDSMRQSVGGRLQRRSSPALLLRGAAAWQTGHFRLKTAVFHMPQKTETARAKVQPGQEAGRRPSEEEPFDATPDAKSFHKLKTWDGRTQHNHEARKDGG